MGLPAPLNQVHDYKLGSGYPVINEERSSAITAGLFFCYLF